MWGTFTDFISNPPKDYVLADIQISAPPRKVSYKVGEAFDPAGMVVMAVYSNGFKAKINNYTYSPTGILTDDDTEITVTYAENDIVKTASISLTIIPKLISIEITTMPTKQNYKYNDFLDFTGAVVTASYSNGSTKAVNGWTISTDKLTTLGSQNITVTYTEGGITATADVPIIVSAIVIPAVPSQANELTYTGGVLTPTWNDYDSTQLTMEGTESATNAGDYTVTFTPVYGYVWADSTSETKDVVWTIDKAIVTDIPSYIGTIIYNGSAQAPNWINYDSSSLSISGDTSGTNAGDYTTTFTPNENYAWVDGSTESQSVTWSIERAIIEVPTQTNSLTYNGETQSPVWSVDVSDKADISGATTAVNAGTYSITLTPTENYCWPDGSIEAKTLTWSIAKVTLEVPAQVGSLVYNGNAQQPIWSNDSINFCDVAGTESSTNAGTFTVSLTPYENYQWTDGTDTTQLVDWNIGRAVLQVPQQSGVLTYNTNEQTPTLSNNSADNCTIGGVSSATNAGTYTMTLTPNSNYQWNDNSTEAKDITWVIGKATPTFTLSTYTISLTSNNQTATVTYITNSDGSILLSSNDESIVDIYFNEDDFIEVTGIATGGTNCLVSLQESANYISATATIAVTVEMKPSRLPNGYIEVEYIKNPNFGYIHNNFIFKDKISYLIQKVEMDISSDITTSSYTDSSSSNNYVPIFGFDYNTQGSSIYNQYRLAYYLPNYSTSSYKNTFRVAVTAGTATTSRSGSISFDNITVTEDKLHITIDPQQVNGYLLKINNAQISSTKTLGDSATTRTTKIFGYARFSTSGSLSISGPYANYKLYSLKISNSNTDELYAEFVPCLDSNGIAGLYDIVRNVFLQSDDTDKPFVAGPAV